MKLTYYYKTVQNSVYGNIHTLAHETGTSPSASVNFLDFLKFLLISTFNLSSYIFKADLLEYEYVRAA